MVQLGYGLENQHSDDFETGIEMRQAHFNDPTCQYDANSHEAVRKTQLILDQRGMRTRS